MLMERQTHRQFLADLPTPDAQHEQIMQRMYSWLRQYIADRDGAIGFDDYLYQTLYAPSLGYYTNDTVKFGPAGDYTTAAEASPLYNICLARCCQAVLGKNGADTILELGAGSGRMAMGILDHLHSRGETPRNYLIYEPSITLRMRQQRLFEQHAPQLRSTVVWLDALPRTRFRGIVLASEVLDALPFKCFSLAKNGVPLEQRVGIDNAGYPCWHSVAVDSELEAIIHEAIAEQHTSLPVGYRSEINVQLEPWLASLTNCLDQGVLLFIDYGYAGREYYHPQRNRGTLLCHYRHRTHDDPFILAGLQDISASVNFSALANAACKNSLQILGYTTQMWFLMDCGLQQIVDEKQAAGGAEWMEARRQTHLLTLPGAMGERFKVMACGKAWEHSLPGFSLRDQRHLL